MTQYNIYEIVKLQEWMGVIGLKRSPTVVVLPVVCYLPLLIASMPQCNSSYSRNGYFAIVLRSNTSARG